MVGLFAVVALQAFASAGWAESHDRWEIAADGAAIRWNVREDARLPHKDFLEMSGRRVSLILGYGVSAERTLSVTRKLVWPWIRRQPNDTHGSMIFDWNDKVPFLAVDGVPLVETVSSVTHDGVFTAESMATKGLCVTHRVFPSAADPCVVETYVVTNRGAAAVTVEAKDAYLREIVLGCTGRWNLYARLSPAKAVTLKPGESAAWQVCYGAFRADAAEPACDAAAALAARRARVDELTRTIVLETGDRVLDTAFRFAKIRAGESIFETAGGLMHGPGGGRYYAATWCNDQAEYAGPWFAFTGDATALEASFNAYRHYLPFMGADFEPIPSSVIAEGRDYWNGARDRGDAAMWAYGMARFVLASGRRDWAQTLRPGLRWTLEYCRRQLNEAGVVRSDRDELEGRLPAGKANLCTSSLYYDALVHAAALERELGDETFAKECLKRAADLRTAIDRHFGAKLHGFNTYRYYDGCTVLRSWIGIPLCMGITERAADTTEALLSPYLRTQNAGLLCAEGDKTGVTWDRSQLYAFRGILAAGLSARVLPDLGVYSRVRLLGEHVPYPVEAWPEGDMRHLSAESALYCRVFSEGLFGLDPTGFGSFRATGRLPKGWKRAALRNIHAFGRVFDIELTENGAVVRDKAGNPAVARSL